MKPEEIKITDWARIFIGEVPSSFYIELIIRTAFVYLLLMVAMRILGRRMAAQLNKTEMAALVSLAAAIGIPIQAPDRGILPAIVIAIVVVLIGRLVAFLSSKYQSFEKVAQADLNIMIEDGRMRMDEMRKVGLTRERLMAEVRSEGITHLGKITRLYMEAGGSFSIVNEPHPKPGLSAIPEMDTDFENELLKAEDILLCCHCGEHNRNNDVSARCSQCGDTAWVAAVNEHTEEQETH
jgi:uncharacterized membrane protein YcaP (DUF421 family)